MQGEFEKADRNIKPDPGRVTARRLNRAEYTNTIRDLLGVEFRAEKSFPTDDLGNGFDNIGDVLTDLAGADGKVPCRRRADRLAGGRRRSAARKPLKSQFAFKDTQSPARGSRAPSKATGRIEFDGEYTIRFGLPGERAPDGKPVTLGFWMDGKLLHVDPGRDQALGAGLLQSLLGRADAAVPAGRRSRLPRGLHRRRFRQER